MIDDRTAHERCDEHNQAIADLRDESGKHARQLFAQANELDDLRAAGATLHANAAEHGAKVERVEKSINAIAAEMQENNKLQRRVLVAQRESNEIKLRQEAQFREAVDTLIRAVRSPRAIAAVTLGAFLASFFFALFERIFR